MTCSFSKSKNSLNGKCTQSEGKYERKRKRKEQKDAVQDGGGNDDDN
jgi:hypothetical protein